MVNNEAEREDSVPDPPALGPSQPETEFERVGGDDPLPLHKEFWLFICENKAWWMVPIVLSLLAIGILVAFSSTGAAPFIYTLF